MSTKKTKGEGVTVVELFGDFLGDLVERGVAIGRAEAIAEMEGSPKGRASKAKAKRTSKPAEVEDEGPVELDEDEGEDVDVALDDSEDDDGDVDDQDDESLMDDSEPDDSDEDDGLDDDDGEEEEEEPKPKGKRTRRTQAMIDAEAKQVKRGITEAKSRGITWTQQASVFPAIGLPRSSTPTKIWTENRTKQFLAAIAKLRPKTAKGKAKAVGVKPSSRLIGR